jgi:hypothetical protein
MPSEADILSVSRHVSKVPIPDSLPRSKQHHESTLAQGQQIDLTLCDQMQTAIFQSYLKNGLLLLGHIIAGSNRLEFRLGIEHLHTLSAVATTQSEATGWRK